MTEVFLIFVGALVLGVVAMAVVAFSVNGGVLKRAVLAFLAGCVVFFGLLFGLGPLVWQALPK